MKKLTSEGPLRQFKIGRREFIKASATASAAIIVPDTGKASLAAAPEPAQPKKELQPW